MSLKISKDFLVRNLKVGENEVFIKEKDSLYCQFDELRINQNSQTTIEVVFLWKDQLVSSMQFSCNFSTGNILYLCGFVGKMEVSFEGFGETDILAENLFWVYTKNPSEKGWYPVKILVDAEAIPTSAYWDGTEWNRSCILAHGERCANKHQAKDLANKNC